MIVVNDPHAGEMISAAVGKQFHPDEDVTIVRYRSDGKLLGGALFENYTGNTMTIHQAGWDKRWINRELIYAVFHYAFEQVGCLSLIGPVKATDTATLDITRRLGFVPVFTLPSYFPDNVGLVVTRMWRIDCRWLDQPRKVTVEKYG